MYNDDFYDEDDLGGDREQYTVEDALAALPMDEENIIPAPIVIGFSDLSPADLEQVRPVWNNLPFLQRVLIMERLAEASEADFALDYSAFATLGYNDKDPEVRLASIEAGKTDETVPTLNTLLQLAAHDPVPEVRAAAILQLGEFISLGEMEELDKQDTLPAENLALQLFRDPKQPIDVQRRALEAISRCTRDEVPDMIREAYNHDDFEMKISAVTAMGNTIDPMWSETVLQELETEDTEMLFEAIRAAGSLGIQEAVPALAQFGYDEDPQIQDVAIWSLGEIGGEDAIAALNELAAYADNTDNDDLSEAIEEALSMAELMSDMSNFDMLAFEEFMDDEYDDEE